MTCCVCKIIQNCQDQEIPMAKWTFQGSVGAALYPMNTVWLIEEAEENPAEREDQFEIHRFVEGA